MKPSGIGQTGSLESNDLMVIVDLNQSEDLTIEIESIVKEKFGEQIKAVVEQTLQENNIKNGYIKVADRGALDFAIRARLKTAIKRAEGRA
ncbi:citrate lyase acyl carrier protein [Alkaliphilus metalliredigens QYMF]|uniref:Citrate lyase acyl carrier protein n=1 Tax=Alkaliphilus metalliredigens (strain QYMF) TaxID=293826 RepID=A6TT45_ALKMQ|nr:citrate lyase acyl carrier protein [Alkaliphilus metalliredigens]ABR49363.1 citrate lyase acyl carrier protein [Alkaliphilus metalliredigens QYMF]